MHSVGIAVVVFIAVSLLLGTITRWALARTPIPYSAALVVLGLLAGLGTEAVGSHWAHEMLDPIANVDPHLLLLVFLPALIFESAYAMDAHLFRRILPQIAVLAVPGLLVTGTLTAVFAVFALPWEWSWPIAFTFGMLASATDPVAVVSLLKDVGASKRLGTLIEGESLMNDGTAIVFFGLFYLMAIEAGDAIAYGEFAWETARSFVWVVSMGALTGVVLGSIVLAWVGRIFNDALIEITVTLATSYMAFYVAEHLLHGSGVVAVVVLAIALSSTGRTRFTPEVTGFLKRFWGLTAYIANTIIFLLVGIVIALRVPLDRPDYWWSLLLVYAASQILRAAMIGVFYPLLQRIGIGLTRDKGIILWWGGLRGAVALALALVVVQEGKVDPEIAEQILFLTAGLVLLTILVNGGTMRLVLKALGMDKPSRARIAARTRARVAINRQLHTVVSDIQNSNLYPGADWMHIRGGISKEAPAEDENEDARREETSVRRQILEAEKASYWKQFEQGSLGRAAVKHLADSMDVVLDGYPHIGPRANIAESWRMPFWARILRNIGPLNKWVAKASLDRIGVEYEVVRAFLKAQDENLRLVGRLHLEPQLQKQLRDEILLNKRHAFGHIEQLRTAFPEIQGEAETRAALHTILNREHGIVQKLIHEGVLEKPDAKALLENLEHRRKMLYLGSHTFERQDAASMLRSLSFLQDVPDELQAALSSHATPRVFQAGEKIIRQGDDGDSMFILVRGAVAILIEQVSPTDPVDILGPGTVFGEMSLLTGAPRSATVRAELPTEVLVLDAESSTPLMQQFVELEDALWHLAAARWAENSLRGHPATANMELGQIRAICGRGTLHNLRPDEGKELREWETPHSAILIEGKAMDLQDQTSTQAPALLTPGRYVITDCARIYELPQNVSG